MLYPPAETVNPHLTGAGEFSTGVLGEFSTGVDNFTSITFFLVFLASGYCTGMLTAAPEIQAALT
jgi:hypothetical protein